LSTVFTPDDLLAYVRGVPELDAFARFLAASKARSNFSMWTTFTQLCGGYYLAHVGPVLIEPELINKASFKLWEYYLRVVAG
jgi:hypothetical protein